MLAIFGLSIPLIFHAVYDIFLIQDPSEEEDESVSQVVIMNTLIFTLGDIIPIIFQFSSLIFGYIRHKENIDN